MGQCERLNERSIMWSVWKTDNFRGALLLEVNATSVTSVYDRNEFLPEKCRAVDVWSDRLLEIVES